MQLITEQIQKSMEGSSWIRKMFENSKDITFAENSVTIRGALNAQSTAQLEALAEEFKA